MTQPGVVVHTPWNEESLLKSFDEDFTELIRFASASAVDSGFAALDAQGLVAPDSPVELWITARMTYVFALAQLRGLAGAEALVRHGLRSLRGPFHDDEFGGWFSALDSHDEDAAPAPGTRKEGYAHAFVILAAAAAQLAGHEEARELLDEALEDQDRHWWEPSFGRVRNSWNRDWSECEDYRSLNTSMHTVEAYLAAFDASGQRRWLDRAREMTRFVADLGACFAWRLPEHFDASWRVQAQMFIENPADPFRPYGATPGHGFEWARLILHVRAALISIGDTPGAWMLEVARALVERADEDGWDAGRVGGIVYTTDFDGRPVVSTRMHWAGAEAVNAALILGRVLEEEGDEAGVEACSERFSRYVSWMDQYAHEGPGRWIHEINERGEPGCSVWPGKPDAYHIAQMLTLPRIGVHPGFAAALKQAASVWKETGTALKETGEC